MNILIVEDEESIATYVKTGLEKVGYHTQIATTAKEAVYFVNEMSFDLIILDIKLPDKDGWDVLATLKTINQTAKIIFLSALNNVEARVKGLNLGADDYLTKPFSFSELLARVRAQLRRQSVQTENEICVDDLKIDHKKMHVTRGGIKLDLTTQEYTLLLFLAEHTGDVLSRQSIADSVWGMDFDINSNVVDVAIKRLRKKMACDGRDDLIHTVRGIGYVFEKR